MEERKFQTYPYTSHTKDHDPSTLADVYLIDLYVWKSHAMPSVVPETHPRLTLREEPKKDGE